MPAYVDFGGLAVVAPTVRARARRVAAVSIEGGRGKIASSKAREFRAPAEATGDLTRH